MPTIFMMCSPFIYELMSRMCDVEKYHAPDPEDFDGKPMYYNYDNIPLDQIKNVITGEPINPEEVNIIHGPVRETREERSMTFHNYAKRIFCQWVEIAFDNPIERAEHISDDNWEAMMQTPNEGPPPTPFETQGSPPYLFAVHSAFRILCAPLLTKKEKWYVVIAPEDVDHPDTPEPEPEPGPTPK